MRCTANKIKKILIKFYSVDSNFTWWVSRPFTSARRWSTTHRQQHQALQLQLCMVGIQAFHQRQEAVHYRNTANNFHHTKDLYLSPKFSKCTIQAPYCTSCTVHFAAYVIFSNIFENAVLRTNFLNFPFSLFSFKIARQHLGITLFFTLPLQYGTPR